MLQITESEILEAYDAFELSESELIELYSEGYISENTMDQLIEMGIFDEFLGESVAGDAAIANKSYKLIASRIARPEVFKRKIATMYSRGAMGLPVSAKYQTRSKAIDRHIERMSDSDRQQAKQKLKNLFKAGFKARYSK